MNLEFENNPHLSRIPQLAGRATVGRTRIKRKRKEGL